MASRTDFNNSGSPCMGTNCLDCPNREELPAARIRMEMPFGFNAFIVYESENFIEIYFAMKILNQISFTRNYFATPDASL